MSENERVKSERTFEIPCQESLLEMIAERRLKSLSPFLTQENKQSKKLERKNQMSSKQIDHYLLVSDQFDGSDESADDDPATRRPSPPENEGDNGKVAAERKVRPKSVRSANERVRFATDSPAGTTSPAEADAVSLETSAQIMQDIPEHDVNAATSAIWLKTTIRNKIDEGENSVAAIDANERRHAHELNFISPHPSSTSLANSNGQMLTNNEQQNKHNDMKRMPRKAQPQLIKLILSAASNSMVVRSLMSIELMFVMCKCARVHVNCPWLTQRHSAITS
jgi:hypothetical protein